MTDQLLQTKLFLPKLPHPIVHRPNLINFLNSDIFQNNEFGRKLTLVSAPAGYGKSSLVIEWLHFFREFHSPQLKGSDVKLSWLSLDEYDNDPGRFIIYLIASLRQSIPEFAQNTLAMLKTPQPPSMEIIISALVNEITAAPFFIVLVLDDYHIIHTPAVHHQVAFLLEHQPTNFHLVVITREDPLLPIGRMRANGQLLEIRQNELGFSNEESAEFLNSKMGLNLSRNEISALNSRTEGWIAGLQLAALSMRSRFDKTGFIQAFTGSNRFVLDYLIEEVFEQQSPEVKEFILKTSILEILTAPICDSVAETTGSQKILEALERSNLFINSLDQTRSMFRYHQLFAELLRHRLYLSEINPEALHLKASQWFEENELMNNAVEHAIKAKNWQRATTLINTLSTELLKNGEIATLLRWYQLIPEDLIKSDPKLCFDYCWPLLLAGKYDIAGPLLIFCEQAAESQPEFLGEVYAAQAYMARSLGNHSLMMEKSQKALGLLSKNSLNSRGIITMNLGLSYWHTGQMEAAEKVLIESLEIGRGTNNHYATLTSLIFLGRIHAVFGELRLASDYFNQAIQHGTEIPINALAYMDLASISYEWDQLDLSENYLQQAIDINSKTQNHEFMVGCYLMLIRLNCARGDIAAAEEAILKARALIQAGNISDQMVQRLKAAEVWLLIQKGEGIGLLAKDLVDQCDSHTFYRFLDVTKALALPQQEAIPYLVHLAETATQNNWIYGLIAVRIYQSILAESLQEKMNFLFDALQRAEPGGFIRSFIDAGKELVPLLKDAVNRNYHREYASKILSAMETSSIRIVIGQKDLIEPLSERELEVLKLVTAGRSNREIGEELFISTGTAKTHIHNLCGKLGVHNRTEAAIKAKDLGLV